MFPWLDKFSYLILISCLFPFGQSKIRHQEDQRLKADNFVNKKSHDKLCVTSSFERCLSFIKEITEKPELAFASTAQHLNKACRKLQQGVRCADDHMNRCSSLDEKLIFEEVVRGSRKVIQMLCRPGKLQTTYLKFAPCLKNMANREDDCYFWIQTVQNMSIKLETENSEDNLKKFCCSFSQSVDCQVTSVRRSCGEDAVNFFKQHLDQMSTTLIDQHCTSYTYLPDNCIFHESLKSNSIGSKGNRIVSSNIIPIVIMSALIFIEEKFILRY